MFGHMSKSTKSSSNKMSSSSGIYKTLTKKAKVRKSKTTAATSLKKKQKHKPASLKQPSKMRRKRQLCITDIIICF